MNCRPLNKWQRVMHLARSSNEHKVLKPSKGSKMPSTMMLRGCLKRSAHAVQLFGRLAVVETHTLWYFGHHGCLVVGFDAPGIWHFWIFTVFYPFLPFCTHFLLISTTHPIPVCFWRASVSAACRHLLTSQPNPSEFCHFH